MPIRRRTAGTVLGALVVAAAAGCSSAVPVDPATYATDPSCAALILATPDSLGTGLGRRLTTAQATTAWGDPAIVLRCGVAPPGPTTEHCETVSSANGPSIDWLVVQDDPGATSAPSGATSATSGATSAPSGATSAPSAPSAATGSTAYAATDWTFTTYGRVPAVEVHVPAAVAAERSTTFLDGLGPAIAAHTQQLHSCL